MKQKSQNFRFGFLCTPYWVIFETIAQTFKQLFRNFLKNQTQIAFHFLAPYGAGLKDGAAKGSPLKSQDF